MPVDPFGLLTEEQLERLGPELEEAQREADPEEWKGLLELGPQSQARLQEYVQDRQSSWEGQTLNALQSLAGPTMHSVDEYKEMAPEEQDAALVGAGLGAVGSGVSKVGRAGQKAATETFKFATGPKVSMESPTQILEQMKAAPVDSHKFKRWVAEFGLASPETIFKMDKSGAGRMIYRIADETDQAVNRFLVNSMQEFKQAAGKVKKGSEGSARVARALDGKLPREQLSKPQRRLYDYLKDKFDFLYNQYARQLASSDEMYEKLSHAASMGKPPRVRPGQLPPNKKALYDQGVARLVKKLKGRSYKDLKGQELKEYNEIRKELGEMLEQGWLARLAPNDREAYAMMRRKIKDYLPHMFDRDVLMAAFREEGRRLNKKLRVATGKQKTAIQKRLRKLNESLTKLEGGGIVKYQDLPREFRFKYFQPRKGKEGYEFDAVKAYETYLHGFARKFFGDPALKAFKELFLQVDPALKPYARRYIESWAGLKPTTPLDTLTGWIAGWQWMTKLGMNPRSALTNFSQRLNTIAAAGELSSARGWAYGWTREGDRLFKSTGLGQEVPKVLMEGPVPKSLDQLRQVMGVMFTKVEMGNRKHAFLTGYLKALRKGASEKEAIKAGADLVHLTQFRYGRVGMPMPLRGPVGRLAFQFWSYPIKQMEFLVKLGRKNPLKVVKLLAYAEGGNQLVLRDMLGVDMSTALGFGLNWGEALETLKSASEGDIRRAYRHMRLTLTGGGLLPTTLGPTFEEAIQWSKAVQEGRGAEEAAKAIMPIQFNKVMKALRAYENRSDGKYPIFSPSTGKKSYDLTGGELLTELVGPRSVTAMNKQREWAAEHLAGQEHDQIQFEILRYFTKNEDDEALELMEKYPLAAPSFEAIMNAKFGRVVDAETRRQMRRDKRAMYVREWK
jgi:hypothetical protein